jgi:hypothetical protein
MVERRGELLTFEQGLDREFSGYRKPGTGRLITNWEPQPHGGLRARRRWLRGPLTGTPATKRVRALGFYPVHAGFETPVRRQWQRKMARGAAVGKVRIKWDHDTLDGSCLVAFVIYSNTASVAGITITPPTGWTEHTSGAFPIVDADNTLKCRVFIAADATAQEADTWQDWNFTSGTVRRAQVIIQEWRGVKRAAPVDQTKAATGDSNNPNAGLIPAETAQSREVAVGFLAAETTDKAHELEDFSAEWYDYRLPKENYSVGANDYWLHVRALRRVLTLRNNTLNLEGVFDPEKDEGDTNHNWIAGYLTLKAKDRGANDRDYYIVANRDSATTYRYYYIDEDDFHTGGGWTELSPLSVAGRTVLNTDDTMKRLSIASGMGVAMFSHPDFDNIWAWDGDIMVPIRRSYPGETLCYWNNQFYSAGHKDEPNRLYWSAVGDYTTWDEDANVVVGDGTPPLDICPVAGGLLIAKFRELFFFTWDSGGALLKVADGIGGGHRGRCILPVPGGALIAGRRDIWFWGGGGEPELISRPLDDWWARAFDDDERHIGSAAHMKGRAYIAGALNGTGVVFDTRNQTWHIEDPGVPGMFFAIDDRNLLFAPWDNSTTNWSLLNKQQHPWGDRARDEFSPTTYEAETQELTLSSAGRPVTPRWLYVSYKQYNSSNGEDGIKVTPIYDGIEQKPRWIPNKGDGTHKVRLDVGVHGATSAHTVKFRFEHTTRFETGIEWTTTYDIDQVEFVYEPSEYR